MKAVITLVRIVVGLLFIFSGLVKANDPLGLSYKMQEFFELWDMTQFNSTTLAFSVLMNAFEIIAGFALLIGWRIKLFSWLLLLLILFFTFLTGYTYYTGKPTNCGCFGDCLLISSKTSFLKDVALTVLIGLIFWQRNTIQPVFSNRVNLIAMLAITVFSFGIQWYSLNYLPPVDCLPFKKGNNIPEKMKMPANGIPDSTVITFVYEKEGKQIEFTADKFPADFNESYKFISRYDKIVRKGKNNEPPIHGFILLGADKADLTPIVLSQPYAILLFAENLSTPFSKWQKDFATLYSTAQQKNIPVYAVTSAREAITKAFGNAGFTGIPVFDCDYTAIRTAARTNPCFYLLKQGTIIDKQGYKTMKKLLDQLQEVPVQQAPVIPTTDTTTRQP